ncbi:MAG: nuclear transport factor 2 family protein [Burkholderiales bacterium]|nr:MAG: nuclear transport factor 2 family protein [Betaproteobacteria bacterium]TAG84497.1 MAG: nuclear transport factor 2 family protein [Burkholderiales bacterium]
MSNRLQRVATFYETLTEATLGELRALYAREAYFKDPFNEVRDVEAIHMIFTHMFVSLHDPRFVIQSQIEQADEAFLTWEFRFRIKRFKPETTQVIRGASHLRFDAEDRVCFHRDYWDAAEELYEKLPVVGALMRYLKKRVG